jgi:hypothetical protein
MATSKPRVPTYHVVPHFNFAASGGALQLGGVYKDLIEMAPMNRKEEHRVAVTAEDTYPPTTQEGFDATRAKLCTGDFGVWAKALGVGSAGASAGADKGVYESVSCTSVVTVYFDPDDDFVARCLNVKPVGDYMAGAGTKRPPVFLLSGLKVAKKLAFHTEESRRVHAEAEASANVPKAPVEFGTRAGVSSEKAEALSFGADDIVVGFRVHMYQLPKPKLFGKMKGEDKKKPVGGLYVQGAEMLGAAEGRKEPQLRFEEVPIPEELEAQKALQEGNGQVTECWVERTW